MTQHIIVGNYGNDTIALMQWCHNQVLKQVTVVSVATGFAAHNWQDRVSESEALAAKYNFRIKQLHSKISFSELMLDRQDFPSSKFQWCAGFLKGLALLEWLDEIDPACQATIVIARRRSMSRTLSQLPEYIEASEHFGERLVWHPLFDFSAPQRDELVKQTGLELLSHRSLECEPCVNNTANDFSRLSDVDIKRIVSLEEKIGKPMFQPENYANAVGVEQVVHWANKQSATESNKLESFDMGCGSPFACGL